MKPSRIIALFFIILLAAGLVYLRYAPGDDTITVPAGAKAGDLTLKPGTYETEDGPYPADIGTLIVPENRNNPHSRLIALPVVRVRAKTDHPSEPLFRLEGGPGSTNMKFEQASRYAADRDVVIVGYRGVDGSSVLDAPEVVEALRHSSDFSSEASMRAYSDGFRAAGKRWKAEGVDIGGYTLTQEVEDLEAVRTALGYDRIDLVSESAGTRTAMIYAWSHPRRIHRSIMIGVNPPGHYMWDPAITDQQIERYSSVYAQQADPKRTDDLSATIRRMSADMPDRWLFLPIKKGNVRIASLMGMMESTPLAGPFNAPLTLDGWLSASEGDASGLWATTLITDLMFPKMFVWGQYAAMGRIDAQAGRDFFTSAGPESSLNLGYAASAFVWGGGGLADTLPPDPDEAKYRQTLASDVETLLISGELDLSTPPQMATSELLPYLPNGHQVVLAGIGHSGSFWHYQTEAGTRLINTYLGSGRVDDSLYQPGKIDFNPGFGFPKIAKILFGAMIGLALLLVVSLIGMSHRVQVRGHFGRVASAFLRGPFAVVLGLGGWFLCALIVMSTMPSIPIDDELLVTLSAGVAVGLCIYLAWVDRTMLATEKAIGFAAAVAAAVIGAWLGFNAADGMLALVTAVVGPVLAANVALIALDVMWPRSPGPVREQGLDAGGQTGGKVASWPRRIFSPIWEPETWLSFAYLLIAGATGVAYFTIAVTGISVTAGLSILVVGLPFLIGFLGLVRVLSRAEARLLELFVGVRIPRRAAAIFADSGLKARTISWFKDRRTWTSLGYFILQGPLGIAYFTLAVVGLALSGWLTAAPIVHLIDGQRTVPLGHGQHFILETWTFPLIFLAGIVLFLVTAHVVRAVTRAHASYARRMLIPGIEATTADRGLVEAAQFTLDERVSTS